MLRMRHSGYKLRGATPLAERELDARINLLGHFSPLVDTLRHCRVPCKASHNRTELDALQSLMRVLPLVPAVAPSPHSGLLCSALSLDFVVCGSTRMAMSTGEGARHARVQVQGSRSRSRGERHARSCAIISWTFSSLFISVARTPRRPTTFPISSIFPSSSASFFLMPSSADKSSGSCSQAIAAMLVVGGGGCAVESKISEHISGGVGD